MGDDLVFSTASGKQKKNKSAKKSQSQSGTGPTKMRLEKKGRGGKSVTVIYNLPFSGEEAKAHMKKLQAECGCGATFKNGQIELQGDRRDAIEKYFQNENLKIQRAGG